MLADLPWLKYSEGLDIELLESKEEGKATKGYQKRVEEIRKMEEGAEKELQAGNLLDELFALPVKEDFTFIEPSDLAGIKAERPKNKMPHHKNTANLSDDILYNKIYGAWLGRCAGCLLGQPVEGWQRERIERLLKATGNYPIKHYMSSDIPMEIKEECGVTDYPGVYGNLKKGWINNVETMPEDDDTNYTIMGLRILEIYGAHFTPEDVAECWLDKLPILHLCTAERVAYRNLINLKMPPSSANLRNPYREWIGAQIRADFFGYIAPGNAELSSEMAWRDASISHTKNGIYGEMLIAAMLSAAAVSRDMLYIIENGLSMIPEKSRLYAGIHMVLEWYDSGVDLESALNNIHQLYNEKLPHDWCHTIPNAMIVCMGLLYGSLDFEKSIGIAVMAGFDTDCNGATVGSILGMVLGADAIPEKWVKPLNNKVKSGIDGIGLAEISDLADRTVRIAKSIRSH